MPQKLAEKTIFSYEQAAELLPEVRRLTEAAHLKIEELTRDGRVKDAEDRLNEVVGQWAEAMMRRGLEVKGLWLVDFDNGSGYYCWRYPETSLMFYHSYEEGFGGRMRIQ
ncbi:MAG: DUF2203 domain-containing protein [Acidobacteria bacterium]|nr:MAG: DUF2203 domain-containing protein [Acidobacteriota bacterium]